MRLIDADALIEKLNKAKKNSDKLENLVYLEDVLSLIDLEPTAFDKEKVLELLKKDYDFYLLGGEEKPEMTDEMFQYFCGAFIATDNHITIVERGGIYEIN